MPVALRIFPGRRSGFYAPAFESVVYEVRDTAFVPAFCFDFGKYNNDLSALADFDRVIVDDREMEDFEPELQFFINKMWGSRDYLCLMMSCKVRRLGKQIPVFG